MDRNANGTTARGHLRLVGPDVDAVATAETAALALDDRRCLLAGFATGTAVTEYTVAVAETGAAVNLDCSTVLSATPVVGGPAEPPPSGATAAPDLVAVKLLPTLDRARYVFDEPLDERVVPLPLSFSYRTADGRRHVATRLLSVEDAVVIVAFESAGDDVREAVRFTVGAGAVRDRSGAASTPGVQRVVQGGARTVPDLQAVRRLPHSQVQWEFVFDEPGRGCRRLPFVLYRDDGAPAAGVWVSRPDPRTVRVVVPGTDDAAQQQVRAAALAGAVRGAGPGRPPSTLGVVAVGRAAGATGATTGPDLVGACVEQATGQVTLWFDEPLDERVPEQRAEAALVGPSGGLATELLVIEHVGSSAVLQFPPPAAAVAVRAIVSRGLFRDTSGERNPAGSVSVHPACEPSQP